MLKKIFNIKKNKEEQDSIIKEIRIRKKQFEEEWDEWGTTKKKIKKVK